MRTTARPMTPTRFFSEIVYPDFLDFQSNPDSIRHALHACTSLSHLIEHVVRYTEKRGSDELKQIVFGDDWLSCPDDPKEKRHWLADQISALKALPGKLEEAHRICESVAVSYKHLYVENTHLCAVSAGSNVIGAGVFGNSTLGSQTHEAPFQSYLYLVKEPEIELDKFSYESDFSVHLTLTTDQSGEALESPIAVEILPYAADLCEHFVGYLAEHRGHFQTDDEPNHISDFKEIVENGGAI